MLVCKIKNQKKDIAFEKERMKLKSIINKQELQLKEKEKTILILEDKNNQLNNKLLEKDEWIMRLLEYLDMDKNEFAVLRSEKQIEKELSDLFSKTLFPFFK